MIANTHIETAQVYWKKEVVLWILVAVSFIAFLKQV
jgi:hypothetical protein